MLRVKDTDAIRNPEGYLYTVAMNLLREHAALYQHQSAARVEELAADDDRSATLEELFDTQVRAARLHVVLGGLSPKCRAAVYMKYQHGLSYEEIADHMGLSAHMVQKYLGQALAHCRRRMTRLR